jgi:hypothetical protein
VVDTYQHLVRDTVLIRWPRPAFGGHLEAGSNACNYTTQHMDNVGPQLGLSSVEHAPTNSDKFLVRTHPGPRCLPSFDLNHRLSIAGIWRNLLDFINDAPEYTNICSSLCSRLCA